MDKRILGRTGIQVSEIAFGGVEIGLPYGIGINSKDDMLSEKEAIKLLHSAIDSGINFFDTARGYGESENIMGKAFIDRRHKVVISTKCKHLNEINGRIINDVELYDFINSSLQESLLMLQTDYIDLFMLHSSTIKNLENKIIKDVFLDLKKKGVIRATGASTYTLTETKIAIESGMWDVIQLPFNLMDQSQESYFKLAAKNGIGIMVRSVLFKGILSEKGRNLHPALENVEKHLKNYDELLSDSIPNLPTLATKFALSFNEVSSVLIGIDRDKYLHEAVAIADGNYLNAESIQRAKKMCYPDREFLDLPKWDRLGWLK